MRIRPSVVGRTAGNEPMKVVLIFIPGLFALKKISPLSISLFTTYTTQFLIGKA